MRACSCRRRIVRRAGDSGVRPGSACWGSELSAGRNLARHTPHSNGPWSKKNGVTCWRRGGVHSQMIRKRVPFRSLRGGAVAWTVAWRWTAAAASSDAAHARHRRAVKRQ